VLYSVELTLTHKSVHVVNGLGVVFILSIFYLNNNYKDSR
jgi:hypothetical protein